MISCSELQEVCVFYEHASLCGILANSDTGETVERPPIWVMRQGAHFSLYALPISGNLSLWLIVILP
jgi:hypothetical protein